MYITLNSREPFGMAGLWEAWQAPSGESIHSCTIMTTTPNSLIEPIHNRMPVILPGEAEAIWLDQEVQDPELLTSLLTPYLAEEMAAYKVSTLVNSPKNDVAECVMPIG